MKIFLCILFVLLSVSLNAQIITTIAGNGTGGFSGDGGPATIANIGLPSSIATDKEGNVYFSETTNCRIRKINASGIISSVVGAMGINGYGGDGGPATAGILKFPEGLTCDAAGNLYIADHQNFRIRKVDIVTGIITTIAGNGSGADTGDNGPATAAQFIPDDIKFDKLGNLYITDGAHNKIRKINPAGVITTFAGAGVLGFSGDGGPATAAKFYSPQWVSTDDTGNVYITDGNNFRIRKVNTSGIINTIAGNGVGGYNGDNIPATSTQIAPLGIRFQNNILYFSDTSHRIRMIDAARLIHTVAGTGVHGYNGDGIPALSAQIYSPGGITVDTCDNLYFVDHFNYRIRKISFNPNCWPEKINNTNTTANNIKIYPNPVNDELHIDGISVSNKQGQLYRVCNMVGVVMQQGTLKQGSNTINIQSLPEGIYIVELTDEEGRRTVRKIIKQ